MTIAHETHAMVQTRATRRYTGSAQVRFQRPGLSMNSKASLGSTARRPYIRSLMRRHPSSGSGILRLTGGVATLSARTLAAREIDPLDEQRPALATPSPVPQTV